MVISRQFAEIYSLICFLLLKVTSANSVYKEKPSVQKVMECDKCCSRLCFMKVNQRLEESVVYQCRKQLWCMDYHHITQWLYDKIMDARQVNGKLYFCVHKGTRICQNMFRLLYKIPINTYYQALHKIKDGATTSGGYRNRKRSTNYISALEWLEDYATHFGDRMPHMERIYLPYRTKKILIFKKYQREKMDCHLGKSTFYRMWQERFQNLRIKKVCTCIYSYCACGGINTLSFLLYH